MGHDPDILVDLTTAASVTEAEITALTLRAAGVPAHVMANAGVWNPWELGSSGPYRVAVRRRDIARAQEALRDAKADSAASIDWDRLDVGEPDPGEATIAAAAADPVPRTPKRPVARGKDPDGGVRAGVGGIAAGIWGSGASRGARAS